MGEADAVRVEIPYAPRPLQLSIHDSLDRHRFGVVVCHRRFGKTVLAVNHLIRAALTIQRDRGRFAYVGPTYRQAKAVAWDYVKHYSRPIPGVEFNESELRADYPNGAQIRLYGADNPDSLRGIYLDGVVLDEFGLMQGKVWSEVLRPALADREGWAMFIGTPNGRNAFWDMRDYASRIPGQMYAGAETPHPEGWCLAEYKASQTQVLPQPELDAARALMSEDEYAQEFECSFEASVRGAVYAKEMARVRAEGRVRTVAVDPLIPVHTAWDLGIGDSTAIWFIQCVNNEVRCVDYYEAQGEGLGHYVNVLSGRGYTYGRHVVPHDAQVRELGTGRTRIEMLAQLGLRVEVAPKLSLDDGIEAAHMFLKRCYFDSFKAAKGIECLQNYRREENSKTGELKPEPVHDWASHGADAFRYAAIALKDQAKPRPMNIQTKWIV